MDLVLYIGPKCGQGGILNPKILWPSYKYRREGGRRRQEERGRADAAPRRRQGGQTEARSLLLSLLSGFGIWKDL